MQNKSTWIDTGFLVALFVSNDTHHKAAKTFLKNNKHLDMHSVWPIVVETCFFLDGGGKEITRTHVVIGNQSSGSKSRRGIAYSPQIFGVGNRV